MTKQMAVAARSRRRVFTAEFKLEMVRQFEARRANGVSQVQIARELDLSVPMLQSFLRTLGRQPYRSVQDVFPGQGRLPSGQVEVRRIRRELLRPTSASCIAMR